MDLMFMLYGNSSYGVSFVVCFMHWLLALDFIFCPRYLMLHVLLHSWCSWYLGSIMCRATVCLLPHLSLDTSIGCICGQIISVVDRDMMASRARVHPCNKPCQCPCQVEFLRLVYDCVWWCHVVSDCTRVCCGFFSLLHFYKKVYHLPCGTTIGNCVSWPAASLNFLLRLPSCFHCVAPCVKWLLLSHCISWFLSMTNWLFNFISHFESLRLPLPYKLLLLVFIAHESVASCSE